MTQRCPACNAVNKGRDYCGGCGSPMTPCPDNGVEHVRDEPRVSDEQLIASFSNAREMLSRLKSRSRSETFYPGSSAPELMRRSEEAIQELVDLELPTVLRDARTANRQLTEALAARTGERDAAWAYIRKATLQLTDFVRGGSELFSGRMGAGTDQEFFPADIDFCFQRAWESRRRSGAWMDARVAELAAAKAERDAARRANERDRSCLAVLVADLAKVLEGRQWLSEPGRGSYEYDDERYQQEFGAALDEIENALVPIRKIARDWSNCPRDVDEIKLARTAALAARQPAPTSPAQPGKPAQDKATDATGEARS